MFVQTEPVTSPLSEELARVLHHKLKQMPAEFRQRKRISAPFPTKVWPKSLEQFLKARWYGGDTAVKLLFVRLIASWDKLPEKVLPCHPDVFTSKGENYVRFILEPAIEKVEAVAPVKLDSTEAKMWWRIEDFGWPGDIATVKRCFALTRRAYLKIKRAADKEPRMKKLYRLIDDHPSDKLMASLAATARYIHKTHAKVPDYASPAYTLSLSDPLSHKAFGPLLTPLGQAAEAFVKALAQEAE